MPADPVILSEVFASQSEANTKSKDPVSLCLTTASAGSFSVIPSETIRSTLWIGPHIAPSVILSGAIRSARRIGLRSRRIPPRFVLPVALSGILTPAALSLLAECPTAGPEPVEGPRFFWRPNRLRREFLWDCRLPQPCCVLCVGCHFLCFSTTISSHPRRYFTRALLHLGGSTAASHSSSVISDAQLTGIQKFGSAPRAALRAHPIPIIATIAKINAEPRAPIRSPKTDFDPINKKATGSRRWPWN